MTNTISIFYIHTSEVLEVDLFQQLLLQLPNKFKNEIIAYKHQKSAQNSLIGKLLLKYGFKKLALEYTLHDIQIGHKDRPYINDKIDFNIAHSGEYVIGAIAQNSRVGIDIEKHRNIKVDLFTKYFNEEEWYEIQSANSKEDAFFNLWTIKESAIKYDGRGVEMLSKTHKIYNNNNLQLVICDNKIVNYLKIDIAANYDCCVCSDININVSIKELTVTDLL